MVADAEALLEPVFRLDFRMRCGIKYLRFSALLSLVFQGVAEPGMQVNGLPCTDLNWFEQQGGVEEFGPSGSKPTTAQLAPRNTLFHS